MVASQFRGRARRHPDPWKEGDRAEGSPSSVHPYAPRLFGQAALSGELILFCLPLKQELREVSCLQLVDGDIFAFLSWESTALVLRTDEEEEGWGERRLLRSQRYALSSTLEPRRVTRPLEEPHVQHG